jgi:hypothetical protein
MYKNDPTLLSWETGNELSLLDNSVVPGAWTIEIASFIKSIDTNHLVTDGSYLIYGISSDALQHPSIDMFTNHYYDVGKPGGAPKGQNAVRNEPKDWTFSSRVKADTSLVTGAGKVFFIGESLGDPDKIQQILDAVKTDVNVNGALVWSLRSHSRDGGFYTHQENQGKIYYAFHWPGLPASPSWFGANETRIVSLVKQYALLFNTTLPNPYINSPPSPAPSIIMKAGGFTWQGSAGAETYQVEKGANKEGPFEILIPAQLDNVDSGVLIVNNTGPGWYRVLASNQYGQSDYSAAAQWI